MSLTDLFSIFDNDLQMSLHLSLTDFGRILEDGLHISLIDFGRMFEGGLHMSLNDFGFGEGAVLPFTDLGYTLTVGIAVQALVDVESWFSLESSAIGFEFVPGFGIQNP